MLIFYSTKYLLTLPLLNYSQLYQNIIIQNNSKTIPYYTKQKPLLKNKLLSITTTMQDNAFPLQNSSFHYLTKPKLYDISPHFSITVLIQLITFLNQHLTPLRTTFTSLNNSSQNKIFYYFS